MMPARVREVLEDEGLEKGVINGAIGQSEEKYKQLLKETNGPDFTRYNWGGDEVMLPFINETY